MGATAPDSVKRLVDHFDQDRKVFVSPEYKEAQLRADFLKWGIHLTDVIPASTMSAYGGLSPDANGV